MKKLLGFLLTAALLFALPIAAHADETLSDDEIPSTSEESENTDPDTTVKVVIVASEDDLPEGYVVDKDFFWEFELDSESEWTRNLTQMLEQFAGDDYVYYFVEKDVPVGYTVYYSLDTEVFTDGNVIIIKNIREGEPPTYKLPETGGDGALYIVIGVSILQLTAAGFLFLHSKRKKAQNITSE